MRIAVIDLGTNTCNLLVAEIKDGSYRILHQSKQLVKLGDNKIRDNEISEAATSRVLDSFSRFKKTIDELQVETVYPVATSAVREAANKIIFLDKLGERSSWLVKVVSGEKEADLIFKGVLLAFNELTEPAVILDIGGGSNELILARSREILWKESRPTGMARIINRFDLSDPISEDEVRAIERFFAEQHHAAISHCRERGVQTLIGCSGAFDTVADMLDQVDPGVKQRRTQKIGLEDFNKVYRKLLRSTREDRLKMKGMDYVRVDLIVPAVILINVLIREIGLQQIVQTDFALREGVLFELMNRNGQ